MSVALSRIERALARIEAASGRPDAGDNGRGAGNGGDGEDPSGLRNAHLALREKVASAIVQIDRLLEAEGTS